MIVRTLSELATFEAPNDQGAPAAAAAAPAVAAIPAAAAPAAPVSLAAAAEAAAPAPDPASPVAPAAAGVAYVPEGLPDTLKGASDKETIDKLYGDLKGRVPPATPEDYVFEPKGDLIGIIDPKTDPVLPLYAKIAHKMGLNQAQFEGSISELYAEMGKAGLIEKPVVLDDEFAALSDGTGDRSAQVSAGQRVILEAKGVLDGFVTRGTLDKATAAHIIGPLMASAKDVRAIGALLKIVSTKGGMVPGGDGGGPVKDVEAARLNDMYPTMIKSA